MKIRSVFLNIVLALSIITFGILPSPSTAEAVDFDYEFETIVFVSIVVLIYCVLSKNCGSDNEGEDGDDDAGDEIFAGPDFKDIDGIYFSLDEVQSAYPDCEVLVADELKNGAAKVTLLCPR